MQVSRTSTQIDISQPEKEGRRMGRILRRRSDRRPRYTRVAIVVSVAVIVLIVALLFLPGYKGDLPEGVDLTVLPLANAILNSFTFLFLVAALAAIRRKRVDTHRRFILAAATTTFFFLLSYVTYHFLAASTPYGGAGLMRYVYFFVLLTHIVLAAATVPVALFALFSGLNMEVVRHRRIARWAMPLWLYTSASGVIVYLMISPYY